MLDFYDDSWNANSHSMGRRSFLRVGSLGLGGLTLANLLAAKNAIAASSGKNFVKNKSVIFLFMHGGPSQFETFDPKMSAPAEIRSTTGEISTAIPGITFGSGFPGLARRADKFSIVRSFTTGNGNHDIKPVVSKHSAGASLGSLYSRVVGSNNPTTGLPSNVALYPRAVDETSEETFLNFGNFGTAGPLGSSYSGFVPGLGGDLQSNMQLNLPQQRFDNRRALLNQLDQARRSLDNASLVSELNTIQVQAYNTILKNASTIFDLNQEDPATIARYDTKSMARLDAIDRKWNNHKRYVDHGKSLGKLLLLARRLCEAGCGFVTISTNFVWDMHADVNNAGMEEGMRYVGDPFDHAVSAFLDDVAERGLSDDILLIATGEMGRDPKINANGGRGHWGRLAPLLLSGGGLNMGQVIGRSTIDGGEPASTPVTIDNLIGTIAHTLFDVGELRLQPAVPSNVMRILTGSNPIDGLM